MAAGAGIPLRVVYNRYTRNGVRRDLTDTVVLFDVTSERRTFERLGTFSFEAFREQRY